MARIWAVTRSESPTRRDACSTTRQTAPRSSGSSPALGDGRDQPRVLSGGLFVAHEVVVEVGRDLEQLVEVGVLLGQQVVELAVAHEDHLDVQGDRLRLERDGAGDAEHLPRRLDADLLEAQGALQSFPGVGIGQHLERVQDQITAVGAVQHAGLDQREVGEQRAHHGDLLHAAHQVEIGRVALVDDRRSGGTAGIDQHVDPIAAQRRRLAGGVGDGQVGGCAFRGLLLAGLQEVVQVVADALLHCREIGRHVRQVLVLDQQVVDQVVDHHGGDLVVQVAQTTAELALPARHLQQHLL